MNTSNDQYTGGAGGAGNAGDAGKAGKAGKAGNAGDASICKIYSNRQRWSYDSRKPNRMQDIFASYFVKNLDNTEIYLVIAVGNYWPVCHIGIYTMYDDGKWEDRGDNSICYPRIDSLCPYKSYTLISLDELKKVCDRKEHLKGDQYIILFCKYLQRFLYDNMPDSGPPPAVSDFIDELNV